MPHLRRFIAIALLALWLPATAHCGFEAAGFEEIFGCVGDHHESSRGEPHAQDGCDIVETGRFRSSTGAIALSPPALVASIVPILLSPPQLALMPPAVGVREDRGAPHEVARTWHFVVRAALPARAPNGVS